MYRSLGFLSFFLRRLTGVALVLYLATHMWVIGSAMQGPEAFDARLAMVQTPFFKLAEIALLAAVWFHAFDGVRLILVNWFRITSFRASLLYAAVVMTGLLTIVGGVPILLFILEG
ncbi:MAG TPA: succinate dehydrogenase, cytochrome b556 subunit [Anaerolineales bacterium]|nr:succinate dehydrogenase, cytochrome b556 subunit [Anaerolineales bacterium]